MPPKLRAKPCHVKFKPETRTKHPSQMKITVTENTFCNEFDRMRPDNFSNAALKALFAYFEEMESDQGEQFELDVIAICCDFTEYESALEAAQNYGFRPDQEFDDEEADERETKALEYLQENTTVLELETGGVVLANY